MADTEEGDLTTLTVQLLSAYVANNTVPANELADLIGTTRAALAGRAEATAPEPQAEDYPRPVSIKKSIASPDFIISMVDGKQYKMLKRHLATNGMTPKEYIERYKLPKDYPMVAPTYAEARRKTAERIGLGRKPKEIAQAAPVATQATKEKAVSGKVPPKPTGKAPGSAKSHPKTGGGALSAEVRTGEDREEARCDAQGRCAGRGGNPGIRRDDPRSPAAQGQADGGNGNGQRDRVIQANAGRQRTRPRTVVSV